MQRGTGAISLSGLLAFVGPLGLYIATLAPGVDFWDIGEMQTVPYLLGIAHPTGFPLFVLAGYVFSHVLPLGTPAWRISLGCALAAATAAYVLFAFVRGLCGDARIACAAALAFGAGSVVWVHAVRADVHDLALAAIAVTFAAALRAGATGSPRALALAALALGCGLATHPIAALVLPSALLFAWPALAAAGGRVLARTAALALLPLLTYAYVPLRSAFVEAHGLDPSRELGLVGGAIYDSGAPATPGAFWRYVTGADFHATAAFAHAFSADGLARASAFGRDIAYREYGYVPLAFAVVGFVYLAAARVRIAAGCALVPAGCAAFAANYPAESDVARYALPGLWIVAACAGLGIWWLATALFERSAARARAVAPFLLLAGMLPTLGSAAHDVGRARIVDDARALGPAIARRTVDGALLVATWNFATPLAYEAYVARSLGTRHLAIGWPHDFAGRYDGWRARYRRVYFVLPTSYDVSSFATPLYAEGKWQLSEMRP
ncbi:MAG: hypothetical protein NVSMB19_07020 [Vulcanimicrobiaceae bacterium]